VIPKYKDISDLLDKGAKVEALERIMELREATLELQEENLDLRTKLKELGEQLEDKAKFVYRAPFYWQMIDDDGEDGPFCQQCHDSDKKNIRLQTYRDGWWNCTTCKNNFGTAEAQSRDRLAFSK
jgi:ribosomal protein L37AE/L43A